MLSEIVNNDIYSSCDENGESDILDHILAKGSKKELKSLTPNRKSRRGKENEPAGDKRNDSDDFESKLINDELNGRCQKIFFNGNVLECDWTCGFAYGDGVLTFSKNHKRYEKLECFFKMLANGPGTLTYRNGDVIKVDFTNGKKHGKGIKYYQNGDRKRVYYINGRLIKNEIEWRVKFQIYERNLHETNKSIDLKRQSRKRKISF